jgi:hypothetical protein
MTDALDDPTGACNNVRTMRSTLADFSTLVLVS